MANTAAPRARIWAVGALTCCLAAQAARAQPAAGGLLERLQALAAAPAEELGPALAELSTDQLFTGLREQLGTMPVYRYRMVKYERLPRETVGPVELVATVREKPYAVRAQFVGGLGQGRVALYSEQLDAKRLRVREPGFASIFGPLWVAVDDPITRRQSNHGAHELGLLLVLDGFQKNWARADAAGAADATRTWRAEQRDYCLRRAVPKEVAPTYGRDSTLCFSPATLAPTFVEVHDHQGLLERLYYRSVEKVEVAADYFTPRAAGL